MPILRRDIAQHILHDTKHKGADKAAVQVFVHVGRRSLAGIVGRDTESLDRSGILRALAERARAQGVKLYICAVDLEKAFDSVDRQLLWAALQRAGIEGRMLATLQALYADVPVCVKTAEGLSSTFQSIIGVKQGCPLSPLLFGLFIELLHEMLRMQAPGLGPELAGLRVPVILYADDGALVATSPQDCQALLGVLAVFCRLFGLGLGAYVAVVWLTRPPFLRGVPGIFGWRPFLRNVPSRGIDDAAY